MLHNIDHIRTLFQEFNIDEQKRLDYRQRLNAIVYGAEIVDDVDEGEQEDFYDFYLVSQDIDKAVFLTPSIGYVRFPDMFVLSDERDYQMPIEEVIDYLTDVFENHPDRKLTDLSVKKGEPISWLFKDIDELYHVRWERSKSSTEDKEEYYVIHPDKALKIAKIILATVYNYHDEVSIPKEENIHYPDYSYYL